MANVQPALIKLDAVERGDMEKNRPQLARVAICVPSGALVHADFALCLATMTHALSHVPLGLISAKSAIVADARNMGVDFALEIGAAFLLFIDSDIIFPRDSLQRLLERNLDVVGATYSRRTPPIQALGDVSPYQPSDAPAGLILMNRMPAGFLLVRTKLFESLARPIFRFRADERTGTNISEDYDFSDRINQSGHRIWCDRQLTRELGHIGQQVFTTVL